MVEKNFASSSHGIERSKTVSVAGCFERLTRNVRTMVRYGFKVDRAKGEAFLAGCFSTCESIAKVSRAASLNGAG